MSKKSEIKTDSGFPVKEVYNRKDISKKSVDGEKPGKYPFTRGIHDTDVPPTFLDYEAV